MLEIEFKYRVADFAPVRRQLAAWGAAPDPQIEEEDQYFNAPDRDFARTDEVLRLRRIGGNNRITYKGSKRPGPAGGAKTRPEIEIPYADGTEAAEKFRQSRESERKVAARSGARSGMVSGAQKGARSGDLAPALLRPCPGVR